VFELAIRLEDGVGVDGDLGDDVFHGRELVADVEDAEAQGLADLLDELEIRGQARARVDAELDHDSSIYLGS
jgi:hypothetical protein